MLKVRNYICKRILVVACVSVADDSKSLDWIFDTYLDNKRQVTGLKRMEALCCVRAKASLLKPPMFMFNLLCAVLSAAQRCLLTARTRPNPKRSYASITVLRDTGLRMHICIIARCCSLRLLFTLSLSFVPFPSYGCSPQCQAQPCCCWLPSHLCPLPCSSRNILALPQPTVYLPWVAMGCSVGIVCLCVLLFVYVLLD